MIRSEVEQIIHSAEKYVRAESIGRGLGDRYLPPPLNEWEEVQRAYGYDRGPTVRVFGRLDRDRQREAERLGGNPKPSLPQHGLVFEEPQTLNEQEIASTKGSPLNKITLSAYMRADEVIYRVTSTFTEAKEILKRRFLH